MWDFLSELVKQIGSTVRALGGSKRREEPQANPADVRSSVAAGEAARVASRQKFTLVQGGKKPQ